MDISSVVEAKPKEDFPEIKPGYTIKVGIRVIEGDRERVQAFEGLVIRMRRGTPGTNVTLRRVSHGVGVERIFPLNSPRLEKIEVLRYGKVRRAKLYYLRDLSGKMARLKVKASRKDELR